MENENLIKFDNFFGQKVDYSFSDALIQFSKAEEENIKEDVILDCWKTGFRIRIKDEISASGGQGVVYTSNIDNVVIKIYSPEFRTKYNEKKLQQLVSVSIDNDKICWPQDVLYYNRKFVGFIMPFVRGKNLYSLTTNSRRIMQKYPDYSRTKQIELIIQILKQFKYLHERNILVGDVKLENIMFDENFNITLIDMDSVQAGEFNCETSTPGYDPPEIINFYGNNNIKTKLSNGTYSFNQYYRQYYRNLDNEYFTLSVLLYRIIMNGQFPYSYMDWGYIDNGDNQYEDVELCVNKLFAYSENVKNTNSNCSERQIWSQLPSFLKKCFVNCFSKNVRYSPTQWIKVFEHYLGLLKTKKIANPECDKAFPENEISYDTVEFSYSKEHEVKGFTMAHAVARLIRHSKSDTLKGYLKEIVQALKQQPQYSIDKYDFVLVYNIGILKKIKIIEGI